MSPWGWQPERTQGIWRHGAAWLRPFAAAVPWITILVLLLMFVEMGRGFTSAKGVLFDLPDAGLAEGESTELVALVMPMPHETLVFFDDARYLLGDGASVSTLKGHLTDRLARAKRKTLLVLADRRVAGGELMRLAAVAKTSGAERILFAEKKTGRPE